jgi:hypothetical protein
VSTTKADALDIEALIASIDRSIRYEQSDDRVWDCLHTDRSIKQILRDALKPAIAKARAEGREEERADVLAFLSQTRAVEVDGVGDRIAAGEHIGAAAKEPG